MKKTLLITLLAFLNVNFLFSQSAGDFRTVASGNWNTLATWQRYDGTNWVAATAFPTSADGVITIRNTHTVTINVNVTIDQVVVEAGGSITVFGTPTITIADGTGVDFTNNGSVNFLNRPVNLNGQFVNNGTYSSSTGLLTIAAATGSFTNSAGASMNAGPITNNNQLINNGTITTNGAVNSSNAASLITNNGTWTSNSTFTINNATSNFTNSSTGIFNNINTFTLTIGIINNNGIFNINAGSSLTQTNGSFTNSASGTTNNYGTHTLNGGTFSTSGTYNNHSLFVHNLLDASFTMTSNITNHLNSTFRYSRNGDQTVHEILYWNLELGGSLATNNKTLTLTSNYTISGNLILLPSALNVVFVVNGAFNLNIFGTTTVNANAKLQPSATTIVQSSNVLNILNGGEIRVTSTHATPLTNQYQNFLSWNVQDSGIVNYFANGTQAVEETLPDGSSYGGLTLTSTGVPINKSLNLTANRTIRGNLIINSTTATGLVEFNGNATLSVGGRVDWTNNGLIHVDPNLFFSATNANSFIRFGANTQVRVTRSSFSNQYQNFLLAECNLTSTLIYFSDNAQIVEALPTNGPLRYYGNIRIVGNRGANNVIFQPTTIGIAGILRDSASYTSGDLIFTGSTLIFSTASTVPHLSLYKFFNFNNVAFVGGESRFATLVNISGNLNIASGAFVGFFANGSPFAFTVAGTTTIDQTAAFTGAKIRYSNIAAKKGKINDLVLNGSQAYQVFGGVTTNIAYIEINGNITNNNTNPSTVITNNLVYAHLNSISTIKTIGGINPSIFGFTVKMNGPWALNQNLVLDCPTKTSFYLNNASLNLNAFNIISQGTGAPHFLDYLPSNVTMPPATNPFCSHPQVINWNCVTAETIYVSTTGNNSNSGLSWATAVRDMRVAVNKVAYGGVIMIANGTYTEIFSVKKKMKIEGSSRVNTILQAPSVLSAPVSDCSAPSQQQDSAIVFFDTFSDSSTITNVRVSHNASYIRRGIVVNYNVKGINIIDNDVIGTYNAGFFGFPALPAYVDCPTTYGLNANSRVYNINCMTNSTANIIGNNVTGYAFRNVGLYQAGTLNEYLNFENNTINNTNNFNASASLWVYESAFINIKNNTLTGTSSVLSQTLDISAAKSFPSSKGIFNIEDNIINANTTLETQVFFNECLNKGDFTFKNNNITVRSGSIGISILASKNIKIIQNTFTPVNNNFKHIFVNNQGNTYSYSPGADIYGNQFNSGTNYGGTAILLLRSDPLTPYAHLNLNGSSLGHSNNVFTSNTQYFLDCTQNLGTEVDTIDMTGGNTFPLSVSFDLFTVEERINHRMDDLRGANGASYPRPIVFVVPRNYFVCNENGSGLILPIDNRSIQDGIDFAAAHDTINIQRVTFSYPTSTEFESTVNFNKPLSFRSNNNGGQPIVDRYITVNLPAASDSITQYNNFSFSDGAVQPLTFQVNQGDWNLNGGVITFANANATLSEALNNTIRGYTGWIQTTRNIGAPTNLDVAGFGAELTSTTNMGTTTIRRGHWEQALTGGYRSIMRVFNISPANNSGLNATFRFKYDPSELMPGQTPANLKQFRSGSNPSPWHNNYNITGYVLQGGTGVSYYVDFSGINAFSSWTLGEATLLPVELLSFNANLVNKNLVRLDWNVANEVDLSHYEIEKSFDLVSFSKISEDIQATGLSNYVGWDYEPKLGVNYYRLKMVDIDGSFKYSEVRSVVIDPSNELSLLVYPNPFNDNLQISLSGVDNLPCEILITDAIGKSVYNQQIPEWKGNTSIDLKALSSGVYYLKLQVGDKSIGTKLIKN